MPSAIPGRYVIKQQTVALKGQQDFECYYLLDGERPNSKEGVEQALRSSRVVSFNCADSKWRDYGEMLASSCGAADSWEGEGDAAYFSWVFVKRRR
jgi:hypothetical protein